LSERGNIPLKQSIVWSVDGYAYLVPERKASSGTILDFARLPSLPAVRQAGVGQGLRILD